MDDGVFVGGADKDAPRLDLAPGWFGKREVAARHPDLKFNLATPDPSGVVTYGVKLSPNPFYDIALEEALRLRDKGIAIGKREIEDISIVEALPRYGEGQEVAALPSADPANDEDAA